MKLYYFNLSFFQAEIEKNLFNPVREYFNLPAYV